jgi:hypothetical protein
MVLSVQRLATDRTVRRSNPGWGEIFCTHPDLPCGPPSLLYNRYRVIPRGKAAGAAWLSPPTHHSFEVKETVQQYPYSPLWTFVACSTVHFTVTSKFLICVKTQKGPYLTYFEVKA